MDQQKVQMIKELSEAFGPSGFEDDVVKVARTWAEKLNLGRVEEDHLRNLYIYRKENTGNKPVLMLDAHSDEVGFMVHSIKPNGTLRFVTLGGWNKNGLASADVLVRNAKGEYIPGVVAVKPVHFMTYEEQHSDTADVTSMVIDVGATSYEEAVNDFHLRIGEPVVPASSFRVDEKRDVMMGKAFDCRIGVSALLETMVRLQDAELPFDVVGVLSAQEEIGERGAKVAVGRVKPTVAICFEGCPADDTFTETYAIQTAFKKGPMLRFMDESVICSPRFQRFTLDLAEQKGLKAQSSVRTGGGNNGAVINTTLDGVPVIVAGVPVRYIHAMNAIASYADFVATADLIEATVRALTPEIVAGF